MLSIRFRGREPALGHPIIEIVLFLRDFTGTMRPISWVTMHACCAEMDDCGKRHRDGLSFPAYGLRRLSHDLWDVDGRRQEAERLRLMTAPTVLW